MPTDEISVIAFAHSSFILAPFSSDKDTLSQIVSGVNDKYISAVMRLVIDTKRVCMGQFQCLSKREFNKTQLSLYYPDDLIENIFRGKPIFNGKNLERVEGEFRQSIYLDNGYNIEYSVVGNRTIFRDRIGGVLIKIKM